MRALVRAGATGSDAVAVMAQRLARLGVADVVVLAAGDCASQLTALAEGLAGRTLIVDADLIVADACLGQLVDDPAVRSGALVGDAAQAGTAQADADGGAGEAPPVRVAQKRIASAGSAVHDVSAPTATSLGALVIDARDVPAATEALIGVAAAAGAHGWHADPIDLALVGLVRAQIAMGAVASVGPVLRGGTPEQRASVEAELAGIDEARVLLERANRPDDGFYSTFVLRRASTPLTALALRMRLTPNQISVFSLFVGLAAALCFATGTWGGLLAGALLMQASLIIDCVDGEVARFTRSFSDLGAWIDASTRPGQGVRRLRGPGRRRRTNRAGHLAAGRTRDDHADRPSRRGLRLLPSSADPGVLGGCTADRGSERWGCGRVGCDPGALCADEPRQPGAVGQEGPAHAHR